MNAFARRELTAEEEDEYAARMEQEAEERRIEREARRFGHDPEWLDLGGYRYVHFPQPDYDDIDRNQATAG